MRGSGALEDAYDDHECNDLRVVVVRYRAELFRYAQSLTRNDADAEDLAQGAALRALEHSGPLRDPRRARSYLFTIARNLATDQARRSALIVMEPRAVVPDRPTLDIALEDAVALAERWAEPRAAVADLALLHREILHLRFVEELDNTEIAERLQVTEHAARQRVYRALQALRAAARERRLAS